MKSDTELLRQYAASQDAGAFAELVRRHAGLVYATGLRVTRNPHEAEDVAQECFLNSKGSTPVLNSKGSTPDS